MPKILHIGDVHLDSPFSLFDVEKSSERRRELRHTFASAMKYAKDKEADIVLIAGDLFDSEFVTRETMELITEQFASNPHCRFVITPGNHDPATAKSAYLKTRFPDNVYIFKSEDIKRFRFDDIGVDVYGFAFEREYYDKAPFETRLYLDEEKINIFLAHADMMSSGSTYCPITERDIAACGCDYVALGHIHAGTQAIRVGSTYYAYCGCPEGRSFDECGQKGGIFINAEKRDGIFRAEFEYPRFCQRRYEKTEADMTGLSTHSQMCEKIKDIIAKEGFDEKTLLRVRLTGIVSHDAAFFPERAQASELGVFYVEVDDATIPLGDYDELKNDISIKGALFRELLPKLQSEDERERKVASLALKYGLSAIMGAEVTDF